MAIVILRSRIPANDISKLAGRFGPCFSATYARANSRRPALDLFKANFYTVGFRQSKTDVFDWAFFRLEVAGYSFSSVESIQ